VDAHRAYPRHTGRQSSKSAYLPLQLHASWLQVIRCTTPSSKQRFACNATGV